MAMWEAEAARACPMGRACAVSRLGGIVGVVARQGFGVLAKRQARSDTGRIRQDADA
jgi:hypothetical protein